MLGFPETKYNLIALLNHLFKYRRRNRALIDPKSLVAKSLVTAIEDAKDYLNISTDMFFEYASRWNNREEQLYYAAENGIGSFYESWRGESAHYNICANILNQHVDYINFKVIYNFMANADGRRTTVDYGCGTASLTIAFALEGVIRGNIILLDVENDIKDFIRFRLKKHNLESSISWHDAISYSNKQLGDLLYCIDVLEHLENSSAIFMNRIHPLLKLDGLLYLKAPWRGQLTHIDAAADDFYFHGGRKFLTSHYKLINRLQAIDIAGIYKKIKE